MRLVFDLDECLVATREANRVAYLEVGVVVPDDERCRYLPWSSWPVQPTPEQRAEKQRLFPKHLRRLGKLLPAARLLSASKVIPAILTGTSQSSVAAIVAQWPQLGQFPIFSGMTPEDKILWLRAREVPGVYFDDWSDMVRRVRKETTWQAIDVTGF